MPDYHPNPDFRGKDRATLLVEIARYKIQVEYYLRVGMSDCPNDVTSWKISSTSAMNAIPVEVVQSGFTPDLSRIMLCFGELAGQALGETSGTDITLDSDAAGHDWYFDWQGTGDDWLPTSNPHEWMASPGSRMDFLSVFLHEYGHALGLKHSHDSHDLIVTTLQPSMRRLPSAEGARL